MRSLIVVVISSGSMGETRDDQDKKEEEEEDKRTRHFECLVGLCVCDSKLRDMSCNI